MSETTEIPFKDYASFFERCDDLQRRIYHHLEAKLNESDKLLFESLFQAADWWNYEGEEKAALLLAAAEKRIQDAKEFNDERLSWVNNDRAVLELEVQRLTSLNEVRDAGADSESPGEIERLDSELKQSALEIDKLKALCAVGEVMVRALEAELDWLAQANASPTFEPETVGEALGRLVQPQPVIERIIPETEPPEGGTAATSDKVLADTEFKCDICGKPFDSKSKLGAHRFSAHTRPDRKSSAETPNPPTLPPPSPESIASMEQAAKLLDRHAGFIKSNALKAAGGDADLAEDIAQDARIRAIKAFASFSGQCAFTTWMYRIITNSSRDLYKKRMSRPQTSPLEGGLPDESAIEIPDGSKSPLQLVLDAETEEEMLRHILALEPDTQQVLLGALREDTYEAMADYSGVSVGTVKSRLHRARKLLEQSMQAA